MWSFCFNSLQNFARVCCFCFLEKEILTTLDLRKRKGEQNLALSSHHFKFPLKTKVPVMSIQSGLWEQDDWRREVMSCESICSVKAGKSLPSHLSFFTVLFAISASPLPGLLVVALTHWKQKGSWALAILQAALIVHLLCFSLFTSPLSPQNWAPSYIAQKGRTTSSFFSIVLGRIKYSRCIPFWLCLIKRSLWINSREIECRYFTVAKWN